MRDGRSVFGGIKARLGFADQQGDYDDEYYGDDYDDYDEGYAEYDEYATAPDDGYLSSTSRPTTRVSSTPRLVSYEDVRANTTVPQSLNRDPLPPRHVTSAADARVTLRGGSVGGRTMVDSTLPPQMTPEGTAAEAAAASRRRGSEGVNALFSSTLPDGRASGGESASRGASSLFGAPSSGRKMVVITPSSYADAEEVAKGLKVGNAVVLVLRNTAPDLAKRVLDFSFGAAAALDASVDVVAEKVFALTRLQDLTDGERDSLRAQGLL